ncbi:MAG: hypothetical protein ABIH39_01395 [Candidatus Margulisiibacteriota bacterium]
MFLQRKNLAAKIMSTRNPFKDPRILGDISIAIEELAKEVNSKGQTQTASATDEPIQGPVEDA